MELDFYLVSAVVGTLATAAGIAVTRPTGDGLRRGRYIALVAAYFVAALVVSVGTARLLGLAAPSPAGEAFGDAIAILIGALARYYIGRASVQRVHNMGRTKAFTYLTLVPLFVLYLFVARSASERGRA